MTWNGEANINRVKPVNGSQTQKISEAVKILEKAIERDGEDTLFLWTGGKEANVIADLLLYTVGEQRGQSPIPFGIIDTGNQFDEIYSFREKFMSGEGDKGSETTGPFSGVTDVEVAKYDEMLDEIIDNENDPRGYHGEYQGKWKCGKCGEEAVLDNKTVVCNRCSNEEKLKGIRALNTAERDWGVAESCGALKVEPLKRFINEKGYEKLVTGVRSDDMIIQGENVSSGKIVDKRKPVQHQRFNPLYEWEEAHVWAYIKAESVSYPDLYDDGYRHTDSKCCTQDSDQQLSEYGEGGIDPEKEKAKDKLQQMGYV